MSIYRPTDRPPVYSLALTIGQPAPAQHYDDVVLGTYWTVDVL